MGNEVNSQRSAPSTSMESSNRPASPPDMRQAYMKRLLEYKNRLAGSHNKVSLEILLENVNNCATRLSSLIEHMEDTRTLTAEELLDNQCMWETATNLQEEMTVEIRTRLEYLLAGQQPTAIPGHDNRHPDHIRRMDAKITPFNGRNDRSMWPTFKARFEQYYHKCQYITDLDKFIKLDEFIVPNSEAAEYIASYDRGVEHAYQDAWQHLCNIYDNPRRQVDETIAKYLATKPIAANREGLSRLHNGINNLVKTLPRLGVDVSTWDPLIVHVGESKLDHHTFDLWQRERDSREVARLAPFVSFLQAEIDRRDHSRNQQPSTSANTGERQQTPTTNSGNRVNNRSTDTNPPIGTPAARSNVKKPVKCPLCNGEHHLYGCDTFRRLDLESRRRKVRQLKVCDNCLRPNCAPNLCTLRPCQNEGCGTKHNGLLCGLNTRPTVNAGQSNQQ